MQNFVNPRYAEKFDTTKIAINSKQKPDIYLVVFDAYLNSKGLKEEFKYNSDLDDFLTANDFFVFSNTKSDYVFTQYSMSSVLNMNLIDVDRIEDKKNWNQAYTTYLRMINKNPVTEVLKKENYSFVNLSPFVLNDIAPAYYQPLQPSNKNLLLEKTLYNKLKQDLTIEGFIEKYKLYFLYNFFEHPLKTYNNSTLKKCKEIIEQVPGASPQFVYTHFIMPHIPYFYDSTGRDVSPQNFLDNDKYLSYSVYCKNKIKEIVTMLRAKPNTIIILISDHGPHLQHSGYRSIRRNLFSIYLPNKQYSGLNDSLSISNCFRIVFNKYFGQNFTLIQ
ncbi:sulfatase-like hydrolase/transferase [Terrimonas sp.]|uniref:sulfatase-like hydrolase/transferase n=1 Tax=Terrimonas sp. TaxID=1914338 RepID=UPI001056E6B6|nr:sulfatase-like hydrolase/transferase [Terrimonas sp.]